MLTRSSCQVASHLKPLDLLHLARVSSTFRNALLSRSSRQAWAAARKNFVPEIPDGPHDLAEPLYARLLFERNCMVRRLWAIYVSSANTPVHTDVRGRGGRQGRLCELSPVLRHLLEVRRSCLSCAYHIRSLTFNQPPIVSRFIPAYNSSTTRGSLKTSTSRLPSMNSSHPL